MFWLPKPAKLPGWLPAVEFACRMLRPLVDSLCVPCDYCLLIESPRMAAESLPAPVPCPAPSTQGPLGGPLPSRVMCVSPPEPALPPVSQLSTPHGRSSWWASVPHTPAVQGPQATAAAPCQHPWKGQPLQGPARPLPASSWHGTVVTGVLDATWNRGRTGNLAMADPAPLPSCWGHSCC